MKAYALSAGAVNYQQPLSADTTPVNGTYSLTVNVSSLPKGDQSIVLVAFNAPPGGTVSQTNILPLYLNVGGALTRSLNGGGNTYYVSNSGNDNNPGTQSQPWQTIAKVNSILFGPGDTVLFDSSNPNPFTGCLSFDPGNLLSTAAQPFTLGSYGNGNAKLAPSNCPSLDSGNPSRNALINLVSVYGVVVQNLTLMGNGTHTQYGILIQNPGVATTGNILIQNNDISDFNIPTVNGDAAAEIEIWGYPGPATPIGIQNISILNNRLHGLTVNSPDDSGTNGWGNGPNVSNVTVQGNEIYNMGGHNPNNVQVIIAGLEINGWTNSLVSKNLVHDIGANSTTCGGPSGIETADVNAITIQNNEVYNVRPFPSHTNGCDFIGIDLDIGSASSAVKNNYVHDNYGAGLLIYGGEYGNNNDSFTGNLVVNNSYVSSYGDASFRVSGGSTITNLLVSNNTFFSTASGTEMVNISGWSSPTVTGSFQKNIFYNLNSSDMIGAPPNIPGTYSGLTYSNNVFYSNSGYSFSGPSSGNVDSSNIHADPKFINPTPVEADSGYNASLYTGFNLSGGSPASGMGASF